MDTGRGGSGVNRVIFLAPFSAVFVPPPRHHATSFDFSPTVINKLLEESRSCDRKRLDGGVEFRVRADPALHSPPA